MDIALAIEGLLNSAKYQGSVTANTQAAYDAIVWQDERTKPTWAELLVYWDSDECKSKIAAQNFDMLLFQSDLFALMPSLSNPDLRLEFAALNTFAQNKDFTGMQQYLGFLLTNSIATQGDANAVLGCVTKQGIVL